MTGYPEVALADRDPLRAAAARTDRECLVLSHRFEEARRMAGERADGAAGSAARSRCASSMRSCRPSRRRRPSNSGRWMREGHHAEETITELDPPRRLAFTWGGRGVGGGVRAGRAKDGKVLLTLTHRKLPTEAERIGTAARLALPPHRSWSKSSKAGLRRPSGTFQEERCGIRQRHSALVVGYLRPRRRSRRSGRRPGSAGRCGHRSRC